MGGASRHSTGFGKKMKVALLVDIIIFTFNNLKRKNDLKVIS